MQNEALRTL